MRINPKTDSLSSLEFGHGDAIEAHLSGSWTTEVTEVSDKRWDDLSGSDSADFDCFSGDGKGVSRHFVSVRRLGPRC